MGTRVRIWVYGLAVMMWSSAACQAQAIVTTAAGNGSGGFSGDGGLATNASLGGALTVAIDNAGNLLICDGGNNRIRRVTADGLIHTIAGGGSAIVDGVPATTASIFPGSVTSDAAGNLYIGQGGSIKKVNTAGIITTIAGNGLPGFSGDGGPATAATFFVTNVASDAAGNLYLADTTNQRIRKIDTAGIITTIAGTGQQGYTGDGGLATAAKLALPQGVAVDSLGNVYFADNATHIRKIDTSGKISTVAGSGTAISVGDGGTATSAGMTPTWVAVDKAGNLYICDTGGKRIRMVNTSGIISTLAGGALNTGKGNGDGGPATGAVFTNISSVAVDPAGNVYVADSGADNVRKVSAGAAASPVSVTPATLAFSVNQGDAPSSKTVVMASIGSTLTFTAAASTTSGGNWLSVNPTSGNVNNTLTITVTPAGLLPATYNGTITITPSGAGNSPQTVPVTLIVNALTFQGVISTVAGNGLLPFSSEGATATAAAMSVNAVAVDQSANIYIGDIVDSRVLQVSRGIVNTLAGNGSFGYGGDGGVATSASLFNPSGVAADKFGNVYIADTTNNRVRVVTAGGISTFAGNGKTGFSGDGGPATSAAVWGPLAVAVDSQGNVYIADATNSRIRKVDTHGNIQTVAGGAALPTFSGDGGPAVGAGMLLPGGVAVDLAGNIYIADIGDNRIRKVNTSGIISTIAGNGTKGFSGDGGPGASASLNLSSSHIGLAVDSAGNLYIPDTGNNRIRKVDTSGVITTIVGNGIAGFTGDGGPALSAGLNNPTDVALDTNGNLYIADTTDNRVRKVTMAGSSAPSISSNGIVNGASFQPGLVANSWGTIQGTGLSTVTDSWDKFIVGGKLPTTVDNVTVMIGGKPAYIDYLSPTQINFLTPDIAAGAAQVTVSTPSGTSSTYTVAVSQYGPAFFVWPNNQVVATRPDFSFVAQAGTFASATTIAAKPGDVLILWGTGFGPTSPAAPDGQQVPGDQTYSTSTLPEVTIGGAAATVYGAALAPGYVGLYQVAIQVPPSLGNGSFAVVAKMGGVSSPTGVVLVVQQ